VTNLEVSVLIEDAANKNISDVHDSRVDSRYCDSQEPESQSKTPLIE